MTDATTVVVAIDGPSGSGKSTVARGVARTLGLRYLDTGAMYRAVTWAVLEAGVELADPAAVTAVARRTQLDIASDPDGSTVRADGVDVTAEIRSDRVTSAVSAVAAVPDVRAELVARQRALIGGGGIVVEGRDIGTAVAPDAPVKVYLTADETTRALRRARESLGHGVTATAESATREALARRDAADSGRKASPLVTAPDAVIVDSTALGVDEVVDRVVALVKATVR